jgi:hypothetical protein
MGASCYTYAGPIVTINKTESKVSKVIVTCSNEDCKTFHTEEYSPYMNGKFCQECGHELMDRPIDITQQLSWNDFCLAKMNSDWEDTLISMYLPHLPENCEVLKPNVKRYYDADGDVIFMTFDEDGVDTQRMNNFFENCEEELLDAMKEFFGEDNVKVTYAVFNYWS